ncbi:hypothetical protein D3C81_1954910 [compost metagenome]
MDPSLTREQVEQTLIPLLAQGIRQKLQAYEASVLIDYRFQVSIEVDHSGILPIMHDVNERKRELLLHRFHTYMTDKLENQSYPTNPGL